MKLNINKALSHFIIYTILLTNMPCAHNKSKTTQKETPEISRKITLTPGYMERTFNSNETMLYGSLNMMQLSSLALDKLVGLTDNTFGKVAIGLAYVIPQSWLALAGNVVYHEFGHARAQTSFGRDYYYRASHDDDENSTTDYAYGLYVQKFLNPQYFLHGAETHYQGELSEHIHNVPYQFLHRFVYNKPEMIAKLQAQFDIAKLTEVNHNILEDAFSLYGWGAGLNNNTHYGKAIAKLIDKQNGHLFYFFDYFAAKTTPYFYFLLLGDLGDLAGIEEAYSANNVNIHKEDIAYSSLASFFLSSTTWSFIYSSITNLPKGNFTVYAPIWKGWRLPDLNFYINSQGLSFELTTGYHMSPNWYVGLGLESVHMGKSAYEISPSVAYTLPTSYGEVEFCAQLHISDKFELGGNISASWQSLHRTWEATIKYIYHNALTLNGERNIPFFKTGLMNTGDLSLTNHEVAITASYYY